MASYRYTAAQDDTTALLLAQIDALRTAYVALLNKLDADPGIENKDYITAAAPPATAASQLMSRN
jgi:hypothetical protein